MAKKRNTDYALLELGKVIGVYSSEREAMEAADRMYAVIKSRASGWILASGYKVEVVEE